MKYLGVDFGLKRIGLATSEGVLASPWKVLAVKGLDDGLAKISQVARQDSFDKIVVGLPEGKLSLVVKGFARQLQNKGLDVELENESLTTKQALEQMLAKGVPKTKRRIQDDYAASVILQNFLDRQSL